MVSKTVAQVQVLQRRDQELRLAGFDEGGVSASRGLDHLRRAVDRGQMASLEALADERGRDSVAAADLEDPIVRPDVELLDDPPQSLSQR
jgi:hypothetical protein